MPTADIDGLRVAYEVTGEGGTPVLLIMGFNVPGRAWRFQVPALSARHRVARFDNRGAGDSDAPPGPYTMAQMAADATGMLDHLGWERAHVVGVSMGGMIAQHMALDHRARVRSLTLIATTPGGHLGRVPRAAGLWLFARAQVGRPRARLDAVARMLFPRSFREEVGEDWLRDVLRHDFGRPPPREGRRAQLRAVLGHDVRARLAELAGLPTLVVKPERDLLVRPSQSDRLHRGIPDARLLALPDAGHGVIRQSADALNAELLAHFARADAAG